jgi:GNAT superfamily N-acetyltransferase
VPLEILPLTEADCLEWGYIHYAAFSPDDIGVVWREKPSEQYYVNLAKTRAKKLANPNARVFKCIDTDLDNQMIGVAEWYIFEKGKTLEEVEADCVLRPPFPEERREATVEFMEDLFKARREVLGMQACVELGSIICHPDHQRRGAASLMLQWGIKEQDRLGVIGYLEGSERGRPLYEKYGFRAVQETHFDATKYGAKNHVYYAVRFTMVVRPESLADCCVDNVQAAKYTITMLSMARTFASGSFRKIKVHT